MFSAWIVFVRLDVRFVVSPRRGKANSASDSGTKIFQKTGKRTNKYFE